MLAGGCGDGSISPIVPEGEEAFDVGLLGTWVWTDSSDSNVAVVTGDPASGYYIEYTDEDGRTDRWYATLGTLGGRRILDVRPVLPRIDPDSLPDDMILPLHVPVLIDSLTSSMVQIRFWELESLQAVIERDSMATPHTIVNGGLVLTGSTPVVRQFLATFMTGSEMMGEPRIFRRRGP